MHDEQSGVTLDQVLSGVRRKDAGAPLPAVRCLGLDYDSRRIQPGWLFFAFSGSKVDGRHFALEAMEKGAAGAVSEFPPPDRFPGFWIEVEHGRVALATAAGNFYGWPDRKLNLTGVTGTNGKTTTAFLIDSLLHAAGKTTALVGTIEYRLAGKVLPAVNTTPESLDLFRMFAELAGQGGTHATLEVSSHALALGRVHGIHFHTAVFTNLTRDHLDFHRDMDDYFAAKSRLFHPEAGMAPECSVINQDDEYGRRLRPQAGTQVISYSLEGDADLCARDARMSAKGLEFTLDFRGRQARIRSRLIGRINLYNILAACGAALSYGMNLELIASGIAGCPPVPGRFEQIDEGQPFTVVVDYAHTDDALRNVIAVARGLQPRRVITLFGCGGDRDRIKRPLMGKAAAEASDFVVLTSDNPRSEDPLSIIMDALVGIRRYDTPHVVEPDREKAIQLAIREARAGDIVILAGKG
ncbi:MAG TPA: UDP-N-acetylmuramoyl-L-alanyl-D-glutamate--2,6-diaminopimelate ligase, partial [Bryobacteraceae bacterium]|nr:UDP-N-acetylmuramoyl-L-alanyl-D-glutamate--2,6-diaminopimelate ligase [Bryobacteraceae bacterium]